MAETLESTRELYVFTGAYGTGKTSLAATFARPSETERVFWQDSEGSANRVRVDFGAAGRQLGHYTDLRERFVGLESDRDLVEMINAGELPWVDKRRGAALIEYYEYVMRDIDENLTPGQYKVFVHDTGEALEAGMAAWCAANPGRVGVRENAAYGRFWSQAVYPLYENLLAAIWARGVDTIIFNFHLKTPWEGGRPVVNKVVMSGKKILKPLSTLMMWLINDSRNPGGEPAGLVLKERLGKYVLDQEADEWVTRRMLPRRIPICTWREIRRYLREGCNMGSPGPGEVPSQDELDMISPLLNNRQVELMLLDAKAELEKAQANVALVREMPSSSGKIESVSKSAPAGPDDETKARLEEIKSLIAQMRLDQDDEAIREELSKSYPLPEIIAAFMT